MPVTAEDLDKLKKCIDDICLQLEQVKMAYCTAVAIDEEVRRAYKLISNMKAAL